MRILFGEAPGKPPTSVQTPESVQLADVERSDVFALPDLEDELDEDEDDDSEEQEDQDVAELHLPQVKPLTHGPPQDWQSQLDAMANQRWLFAGVALFVGAAAGVLLT